jgi:hypothetical protein
MHRYSRRRKSVVVRRGGRVLAAASVIVVSVAAPTAMASVPTITGASPAAPAADSGRGHDLQVPAWGGFAGNAQHTAVAPASPQPLKRIRWQAKVDLAPDLAGDQLLIHYGSPMITRANTVVVPTRVSAANGFQMVAYAGTNGRQKWSFPTDYVQPASAFTEWTPPLPATLTPSNAVVVAGAGGTVLVRANADDATGSLTRRAFYGLDQWQAGTALYNDAVRISTPLTTGADGSVYFGFTVSGPTPANLTGGIARIDAAGHGSWTSAATAAGDPTVIDVVLNSAPALSPDGATLYTTVISPTSSVLVGVDAATLQPRYQATLTDPGSGQPALISQSSSASPTIGPDGDVYYGVLENPFPYHNDRGWLLHFDATLTQTKIPGSFGWDNTVSVLPAKSMPGYHGTSTYLLVSKYNNYFQVGSGDGQNQVAVLDPQVSQPDPFALFGNAQTMKPVQTVLAPTLQFPEFSQFGIDARYEWCINSAVVDPASGSVIANSEDGQLYRWDLKHNRIAETIRLNAPRSEAYTPTIIGPDGTVYAINDSTLYAVGR